MHPTYPLIPPDDSQTPPKQPLHVAPIQQKVLKLSQKVDECKPLHRGHDRAVGRRGRAVNSIHNTGYSEKALDEHCVCMEYEHSPLIFSVGSGIEYMVSNPVRPISTVHFESSTDRLIDNPTGS